MQKPIVITTPSLRAYGYRRLAAGILIGAMLALAAQATFAPVAAADPRMEKACGYPRYPGEALMIGIDEKGQTTCWKVSR